MSRSKVYEGVAEAVGEMEEAFHNYWDRCLEKKRISLVIREDINKLRFLPGEYIVELPFISVECRFDDSGNFKSFEVSFLLSTIPFSGDYLASEYSSFCSSPQFSILKDGLEITQIGGNVFEVKGSYDISFDRLSELLTDMFSALGATENTSFVYNLDFNYTKGDLSLAKFPDGLVAAQAIVNALKECMRIASDTDLDNMEYEVALIISAGGDKDDDLCLLLHNTSLSFDYMIEKEKFERLKGYRNIEAMAFSGYYCGYINSNTSFDYGELDYAALFLTDYVLFLNPGKGPEDITSTIEKWDDSEEEL